ncbi:MAG: tetratricopeptide repeat protein [Bacteroidota bacterium]
MKKISFYAIAALFLFSLQSKAQTVDQLIEEGDKYYSQFNNEKALEVFTKAEKIDPDNWEILWRLSRTYVDIGDRMPTSTDEQEEAQLATFQKALEYADKAVKQGPNQSATFLRRAIANGKIALFKGVFSVAGVVNSVRADVEKAIQLNNGGNFVQGVAHYVLARTHARTSEKWKPARAILGLGWADNEIAIKEYKKAIELYPNYVMFYVDYAHSLIREDEYKTAREMLNKALTITNAHQDDEKRKAEAKQTLVDIKDE